VRQGNRIRSDTRISEVERTAQLAAVADGFVPEAAKLAEVGASVAGLASETEATALRKAVASLPHDDGGFFAHRLSGTGLSRLCGPAPRRRSVLRLGFHLRFGGT
jgi:hypothetical protein